MRCIKINMVCPPMHHFLNVSGFPCFFLAPFNSLLNLSPFETVREPITIPESPVPRVPPFAVAWASECGFPRGCTGGSLLLPGFGQNVNSLFLVRCYALPVFNRNRVCVCCFCFCFFVKVNFVFLSNITSFIYLRDAVGFLFFCF